MKVYKSKKYVLLFKGNSLFIRLVQYDISLASSIYYHTHASKIDHCIALTTCAPTTTTLRLELV